MGGHVSQNLPQFAAIMSELEHKEASYMKGRLNPRKSSLHLSYPYPEPKRYRRQPGWNRRREDRRVLDRRRSGLDLIGPNQVPIERLKAA